MSSASLNVTRIVERQMRNWELSRHQGATECGQPTEIVQFYIAVSREVGSEGEEVADRLASCLDWPKYDREILKYMAEDEEVRRRLYESLDERQRNWLQQLIDMFEPMGIEASRMRDEYFHRMTQAVIAIAQHQHAIFVGRGVNFLLPPSRGLSVRIVAPLKYRTKRLMEAEGLSERDARRRLYEVEARRAEFLVTHFGQRPYDPRRYDMVLNAGTTSVADMTYLVREAAQRKAHCPLPCKASLV